MVKIIVKLIPYPSSLWFPAESTGEFRPGIVASLLSKFSSMGEQPVKSRLLRAGSSGNVSLHQPQVHRVGRIMIFRLWIVDYELIVFFGNPQPESFLICRDLRLDFLSFQPLVNNRLRSLDNLLSGDDEASFHQPRGERFGMFCDLYVQSNWFGTSTLQIEHPLSFPPPPSFLPAWSWHETRSTPITWITQDSLNWPKMTQNDFNNWKWRKTF